MRRGEAGRSVLGLDGLQWDGRKRLDAWMSTYLSAETNALNSSIGRLVLIAAARRVRQPSCKFDQIIVLESKEGTGKSTAIEILAGKNNFSDQTILGLSDHEQQEAMRGVWLYENRRARRVAYLDATQREHRVILKAIRLRNKEAAREAARHHLPNAYECYRSRFPDKPATVVDRARSDIKRFPRVRT
jgi:hypothetical protein